MSDDGPEVQEFDPEMLVRRGNYLVLVTPELAGDWLRERNHEKPNRKITKADVQRYMSAMRQGQWDIDASDIKFSRAGNLVDGQHRLTACVQANVPFPTLIRTGVSEGTRRRVDIGKKRRVGEALQMEGVSEANNVAASINLRLRYEDAEAAGLKLDTGSKRRVTPPSPDDALNYLRAHPEHEKVVLIASQMHKTGPGISKSVWFAFMAMAVSADERDAYAFGDEVLGGDMRPNSPVMALMRYLAAIAARPRMGRLIQERNASDKALTALITTWNAWRMGEQLPRLMVRDTDPFIPLV